MKITAQKRATGVLLLAAAIGGLCGCANFSIGIGLPIGGIGGVGVSVGSDGRVGGTVGVGSGPVGVGGSTRLPHPAEPAASAPRP